MAKNVEYIYIKKVDNSIVHIGSTKDYSKRYKQQADQTKAEFESKELLYLFECNLNEGRQIESEIKKEFGHLLLDHEGGARELYVWNSLSKEKFLHWLRQRTIKEVETRERERRESLVVITQPQQMIIKVFQKNTMLLREI